MSQERADGRRHGEQGLAGVHGGGGGAPIGEGGDGGVHELQEMEWRVMACSIWAVGARMRGLRGELGRRRLWRVVAPL